MCHFIYGLEVVWGTWRLWIKDKINDNLDKIIIKLMIVKLGDF